MPEDTSRRRFLGAAATATGAAALGLTPGAARAGEPRRGPAGGTPRIGASTADPADPRYADLVRGWNARFVGSPDYVRVAGSVADVEEALAEAAGRGKRLAVRSGGHCLENFVCDEDVRVVLDVSQLEAVGYDAGHRAIVVEPGATLRKVYKTLHTAWGVTVPGGACPAVGAGGHIAGGGNGPLARRDGVVADHLYGIEIVTLDESGTPRTVLATREENDPNRELWWAHTGGGGGNFGVVTKYLLRSPGARGTDPAALLPRAPGQERSVSYALPWSELDERKFGRLLRGYVEWFEAHSAPGAPEGALNAHFFGLHASTSPVVNVQLLVDPTEPGTEDLLARYRADVLDPVGVTPTVTDQVLPWLRSTNVEGFADTGEAMLRRCKAKGTYLRSSYTDEQISTSYRYLTTGRLQAPLAGLLLAGLGGRYAAVDPGATAVPQRDSVVKVMHAAHWHDPATDELHLSWVREFYRDVHASSGGVPELDGVTDGAYINYADADLADPRWNTSDVPWYRLYYKDAFERLQAVKGAWDPRNAFRHALSVPLPA
ncbi:FAD-binding oxidoreductase [Streptomyces hoynatensis]|uniref:FAD-binding protein n=1 Tax=Streptomyces hoynatensis TaxID=1141874 RepID=A0A3A9YT28_9ACTN|nr:FAD-binding protein [Streptomyces hoynatensis]RKN39181.1 FAD-binding protein [Streptomyces hoynatensis]